MKKLWRKLKLRYPRWFISKGLLSYDDLCILVELGVINSPLENVHGTSIDVRFASVIMLESKSRYYAVNLVKREVIELEEVDIAGSSWTMKPKSVLLGSTVEWLKLPSWLSAEFSMKSSHGRSFLNHQLSGWVDATFEGTITLELTNDNERHPLILTPGMKIGQIKFFKHTPVPVEHSYSKRGQYQGQSKVQPSKGAR